VQPEEGTREEWSQKMREREGKSSGSNRRMRGRMLITIRTTHFLTALPRSTASEREVQRELEGRRAVKLLRENLEEGEGYHLGEMFLLREEGRGAELASTYLLPLYFPRAAMGRQSQPFLQPETDRLTRDTVTHRAQHNKPQRVSPQIAVTMNGNYCSLKSSRLKKPNDSQSTKSFRLVQAM
jgi:hypothetical protein